jgi:carbonic anhydrase
MEPPPMTDIQHLLDNNRRWARQLREVEPDFFWSLSQQQAPRVLWIGCADSRVPATQITGLLPGEMYVHRNVGNIVLPNDPNLLAALEFGIEVLSVEHVIVCGHYGCTAVDAAIRGEAAPHVARWIHPLSELASRTRSAGAGRLCELNVVEGVRRVAETDVVTRAWERGHSLTVHGWIYGIDDGLIRDLGVSLNGARESPHAKAIGD